MRHFLVVLVLVGSVPVAAGQDSAAIQKKPASSAPQPVTCDALLQHPLVWWLGAMPTPAERGQLAACLAGSGQRAPAPPSVSQGPSAAAQDKPANWNMMDAQQQASWLCRDDPERVTALCNLMVPKKTAAQSPREAISNDATYQRYLTTDLRKRAENGTQITRHFNQSEWENYCVGHRDDSGTCRGWMPGAVVAPAQSTAAPVARWTADTCELEHQALLLLSARLNQAIPVVHQQPGPSPTYRCNSNGSSTTCRPENHNVESGAAAFSRSLDESATEHARVAQQHQFDTRFRE
jgi:hypothetical protein